MAEKLKAAIESVKNEAKPPQIYARALNSSPVK